MNNHSIIKKKRQYSQSLNIDCSTYEDLDLYIYILYFLDDMQN